MTVHRPTPELPAHLEALYRKFPFERSLAQDPLSGVRPIATDRASAEVAGIVAATLAIGNTTAIRGAFQELLRRTEGDLAGWVERAGRRGSDGRLKGFRHRWIRADQLEHLAGRIAEIRASHGSLEAVFVEGLSTEDGFAGGLDHLARALRGRTASAPAGYGRLFPSPLDAPRSPCKRLTLFVRWMVRPSYPDLGVWAGVPTSVLRVPLDQHVHWIAYHLGLTQRRSRTWAAVEEITAALRRIDPVDPIKYDFVLCHTGISGDCPKERDLSVCGPCVVRPDCRLWRGRRSAA